jgi:chemotaxis protein histidine kinase CheA
MEDFEKEYKLSTLTELEDLFSDFLDILKVNSASEITEDNIDAIFRIVHSVKGNSKACEFEDLSSISHDFEDLMLKVKQGEYEFCQNIFDLCYNFCDLLTVAIEEKKRDLDLATDFSELNEKFKNFRPWKEESKSSLSHLKVVTEHSDDVNNKKVLLVDDDNELTSLLSKYIKVYFPSNVKVTTNGNEASKACMRVDYDVIICDYQMPIMDGQTFIKELRENYSLNQHTPVILLSALEPHLISSSEVWEDVFFAKKPVTKKELVYYLRCAFETKKHQKESA